MALSWGMRAEGMWTPMKALHRDLLERRQYNKYMRPVLNNSDIVDVMIGLRFSQLIDLVCWIRWMILLQIFPRSKYKELTRLQGTW